MINSIKTNGDGYKTAVTVRASRKADKKAAAKTKRRDTVVLFFTFNKSLVKIKRSKSFMKNIPATMNISNRITLRFREIS